MPFIPTFFKLLFTHFMPLELRWWLLSSFPFRSACVGKSLFSLRSLMKRSSSAVRILLGFFPWWDLMCSRICQSEGLPGLGLRPSRGKWGDSTQGLLKGAQSWGTRQGSCHGSLLQSCTVKPLVSLSPWGYISEIHCGSIQCLHGVMHTMWECSCCMYMEHFYEFENMVSEYML